MPTRVLFVPGFMQRREAWAPVAELLPQRYPSVLLDHRAHDYVGRLAEIEELGEGAVLAGYSLGGRLVLRAALGRPDRYRGLVLVGASAGIDDPAERAARRQADERLAAWIENAPIEEVVTLWEHQPLFADQSDALVDAQRPGRLSHDPRELASLLRSAGQGALEPVWHLLRGLDLPVLALSGARDERYTAAASRLAAAVPDGRARIVEEAGHAPQLQQPRAVADLLVEFMEALD
jgi:2-succinyl-6-hydroxy-2,4-cyclohexadiene-1-carboxylate synthase